MAAARQSPAERERRHEESTRLLENAIYALEWRQRRISETNARLLFALVSAGCVVINRLSSPSFIHPSILVTII
jgi:hypothetical protein